MLAAKFAPVVAIGAAAVVGSLGAMRGVARAAPAIDAAMDGSGPWRDAVRWVAIAALGAGMVACVTTYAIMTSRITT